MNTLQQEYQNNQSQKLEKDIRNILDDFLEKHPYVHTFLMESMSGGRGISFFGTQGVFKGLTSVKNTLGKIVSGSWCIKTPLVNTISNSFSL